MKEPKDSVRLDRWLNAARFYKTRSQAAKAIEGRKVKVNGTTAKPGKYVHIGDQLTIHHHSRYRNLEVTGLAERGLPASEAQKLYVEEITEISQEQQELMEMMKKAEPVHRIKYKGRPTKKQRRTLDQWKM